MRRVLSKAQLIKGIDAHTHRLIDPPAQSWLVVNLKKQLRELKQLITARDQRILQLSRNYVFTKKIEYEVAMKVYSDQAERIRDVLQDTKQKNQYFSPFYLPGWLDMMKRNCSSLVSASTESAISQNICCKSHLFLNAGTIR